VTAITRTQAGLLVTMAKHAGSTISAPSVRTHPALTAPHFGTPRRHDCNLVTTAPYVPSPTVSTDLQGRSLALRGSLQRLLRAVMDSTSLLLLEVHCPLVLDGPVTAERARGTSVNHQAGTQLLVRQLRIPATDRLPESQLMVVATDEATLAEARSLPVLLSQLLDAHLARMVAESTARGALEIANRDPATGLGNRRAWMQKLSVECARAVRTHRPLTVLILDIDGLKGINDVYGHAAGDRHITRTADALVRAARTTDQVCRLGGDEFGVAAPDTDAVQAQLLAARLRSCLVEEDLQVSIGWAVSEDSARLDDLWQQADASMYDNKRSRQLQP
jgi:diguanylate cyclase (GGDEF)-like protein